MGEFSSLSRLIYFSSILFPYQLLATHVINAFVRRKLRFHNSYSHIERALRRQRRERLSEGLLNVGVGRRRRRDSVGSCEFVR